MKKFVVFYVALGQFFAAYSSFLPNNVSIVYANLSGKERVFTSLSQEQRASVDNLLHDSCLFDEDAKYSDIRTVGIAEMNDCEQEPCTVIGVTFKNGTVSIVRCYRCLCLEF